MELVFLHATDVHYSSDRVAQLKSWLKQRRQNIDVVLVSGDLANAPMDWNLTEDEVQRYRKDLDTIVQSFTDISGQVYYIPGNHDVLPNFKEAESSLPCVTSPSFPCNMHLKHTTLAPNLRLLAIGGSVPGFQGGQKIWDGFPYTTYQEMDRDLHRLLDPVFFDDTSNLKPVESVILMTHSGPTECDTAYVRLDPLQPIVSGDGELYKLLCTENLQKHIVMNIHGHSHFSPGQTVVGKTRILNPGPLQDGCFGIYTLRQKTKPGDVPLWEISSVYFHTLPSL